MEEKKLKYTNGNEIEEEIRRETEFQMVESFESSIEDLNRSLVIENKHHLYVSLVETMDPNKLKMSLTVFIATNPERPNKRNTQKVIESEEIDISSFHTEEAVVTSESYLRLEHYALLKYNTKYGEVLPLYPRNMFLSYNLDGAACVVSEDKRFLTNIVNKYGKPNSTRRFAVVSLTELRLFFNCPVDFVTRTLHHVLLDSFFPGDQRSDSFTVNRIFEGGLDLLRVSLHVASECAHMKYALIMLTYSARKYKITFPSARRLLNETSMECAFRAFAKQMEDESGLFALHKMTMTNPHFTDVGTTRAFCIQLYER